MNYKRKDPALFDAVFSDIQDSLSSQLSWLDNTFGKAERIQRQIEGKRYYEPAWYMKDGDYRLLSPTDTLGNYSFFLLGEPQITDFEVWGSTGVKAPFSLIVWADIRKIDRTDRNAEAMKENVLKVLNGGTRTIAGHFEINRIYERAENVFEGFTLDEVTNQYTMHPYIALRFVGQVYTHTHC